MLIYRVWYLEYSYLRTGEREGSVLSVIDKTITGAGARLLLSYLSIFILLMHVIQTDSPLTSISEINKRLDAVGFFVKNRELVDQVY